MTGLLVAMIGVLYLGVLPTRLIELGQQSIGPIFYSSVRRAGL